ncbi:hypothetical protein NIES4071_20870 [Calothrix sp. NIES-4071]|nr:hypothetical protein NIES4071_20870 [Calothrix sp. NIES-4071]BAZ56419.1 hypothetical protein NIES4105_20820 [Calothrix sp. NIES-4105]
MIFCRLLIYLIAMEIMRLVVTEPVGAGKSVLIRTISEIKVVDTDRKAISKNIMCIVPSV